MCFSSEPPEKVGAKGAKGAQYNQLLLYKDNPNKFQVSMIDAPMKSPGCCCLVACCAWSGVPACVLRQRALSAYGNYPADYVCFQVSLSP